MARRVVSINKKVYDKVLSLISEGSDYIVWESKKSAVVGSNVYVPDRINLYVKGLNPNIIEKSPQMFSKTINNEFRCFFVPPDFTSSDPKAVLRHMKLNITGVKNI